MKRVLSFFTNRSFIDLFSAFLLGGVVFVLLFGVDIINPLNTDWLLAKEFGDVAQPYLSWLFYRAAQWNIIPGLFNTLSYPENVSIIYTDSVPILALFLKVIDSIFLLPKDMQYIGLWSLSCFMLQSMVFVLLCRKFTKSFPILMLCGLFSILSPVMIFRLFWHSSLVAHWFILLCFLPFVYYDYFKKDKLKLPVFWAIIGFLTIGIHSYFIVHCFINLLGFCLYDYLKTSKFNSILCVLSYLLGALFSFFILGGFFSFTQYKCQGVSLFNMNLNSFFNSFGESSFFAQIPNFELLQYEGFSYLGLGFLVLVSFTFLILLIQKYKYKISYKNEFIVFLFVFFLSIGLAVLPVVTYGETEIINLKSNWLVQEFVEIFRSCGRFSWCAIYALLLFCFFTVLKFKIKNKNLVIGLLLSICLFLQFLDLKKILIRKSKHVNNYLEYKSPLPDELINIGKDSGFKHVYNNLDMYKINLNYSLAYWAYNNNLTLSNFYFSRDKKTKNEVDFSSLDTIFAFPAETDIETLNFPYCYETKIGVFCANAPINGITSL